MKFNDIPDFIGMSIQEVREICSKLNVEVVFNDLSNGRYDFKEKRVVRYKIEKKESGEVLVCDTTGFPTLNYEKK